MRLRAYYIILVAALVVPVGAVCALAVDRLWHARHLIDGDLYRAQSVIRTMVNSRALAEGDMPRVYREMQAMNAGPGAWMILYNEKGEQILNTRLPLGSKLPARPNPEEVTRMLASGQGWVTGMRWRAALNSSFVASGPGTRTPLCADTGVFP
jgi:hypothetical protein